MAQAALRPEVAVEEAKQNKKDPKLGPRYWCTYCFNFVNQRAYGRHIMNRTCAGIPKETSHEELKVLADRGRSEMKAGMESTAPNMFFNPNLIEDRTYSKPEVCHILERWGHQSFPSTHLGTAAAACFEPVKGSHVTFQFKDEAESSRARQIPPEASTGMYEPVPIPQGNETATRPEVVPPVPTARCIAPKPVVPGPSRVESPLPGPSSRITPPPGPCDSPVPGPSGEGEGFDEAFAQTPPRPLSESDSDREPSEILLARPSGAKRRLPMSSEEESLVVRKKSGPKRSPFGYKRPRVYAKLGESTGRVGKKFEKGAKGVASGSGWYDLPADYKKQAIFVAFEQWYDVQGKKPDNNMANAYHLFYHMSDGSSVFSSKHITFENYKKCNSLMEEYGIYGYKTQTIVNYNKTLKHFLKFYLNDSRFSLKQTDSKEYERLKGVLNDVKLAFNGLEHKRRREQKETKTQSQMPSDPYSVQSVLRLAHEDFLGTLESAKTRRLNRVSVAQLNRHLCCYLCLSQGHRPSVPLNLRITEYLQGISRPTVTRDNIEYNVSVAEHKTSSVYDAHIVLNAECKAIFDSYVEFVRQPIVEEFQNCPSNFLLQSDGKAFIKISSGILTYQQQYGIARPFTATDARKSFETYAGRVDPNTRTQISEFLAHSEKVARSHYQFADSARAVDSALVLRGITRFNGLNPQTLPTVEDLHDMAATNVTSDTETDKKVEAKGLSPRPPFHSPPGMKFADKKGMIINYLKEGESADDLRNVKIPSLLELQTEFNLKKSDDAKNMQRALRYQKELDWARYIAGRACKDHARQKRVGIHDLKPEDVVIPMHLRRMVEGSCDQRTIKRAVKDCINEAINGRANIPDDALKQNIESQDWPGLFISDSKNGEGRGVFNGVGLRKKGTFICDYHGTLTTREEGLKVLKETAAGRGNYIFTFQSDGKWWSIDGTSQCKCHSADVFYNHSPGRLINHGRKKANLKPVIHHIDGEKVVLLKALRDIEPQEEFLFDYNVDKDEDGNRLPWAKD